MSKSIQAPDRFFKTPFSPAYWRCAAGELSNIRILAVAALFMALDFVISSMFIPVGENLRIYFSFFVKALGCMIYGPVVGLVTGFAGDILGYFVHPNGAFFPGYTLTSMLSALTYALFFYRTKITVLKIFCCKLFINVFINIGLAVERDAVWQGILLLSGQEHGKKLPASAAGGGAAGPVFPHDAPCCRTDETRPAAGGAQNTGHLICKSKRAGEDPPLAFVMSVLTIPGRSASLFAAATLRTKANCIGMGFMLYFHKRPAHGRN